MLFGPNGRSHFKDLGSYAPYSTLSAKNLGVLFDSSLNK